MDLFTVTATLGLLFSAVCTFFLLFRSSSSSDDEKKKKKQKKQKKQYAPAVGTILHQIVNFPRIYDYHTELSRKHKTFRFLSPFCQYIYTSDPIVVEYFLKTNFQNYGKGWMNYENLKDMFGDGIFVVDGDKWRHQRKLASYGFSTKALRDFSSAIFRKNASKLAHVVSSYAQSNEKFDVQSTMDSIFRIGFGVELNCLDNSGQTQGANEFAKSFDAANELLILRYINPLWKAMRYLNIGSEAKLRDKIKLVNEYVYRLINIRVEQASETGNESAAFLLFWQRSGGTAKSRPDFDLFPLPQCIDRRDEGHKVCCRRHVSRTASAGGVSFAQIRRRAIAGGGQMRRSGGRLLLLLPCNLHGLRRD